MTIKEIKAAFYSALDNAFLDFIEKIYSPRAIAEEAAEEAAEEPAEEAAEEPAEEAAEEPAEEAAGEPVEEPTEEAAQKAETYGDRLARALEILKGV